MRIGIYIFVCLICAGVVWATPRSETKRGNQAAQHGELDPALVHYKKALEQKGDSSVILYDLGNVMSQNGQYENAEKSYMGSITRKTPLPQQSETLYNLGNTLFAQQKYDQAVQSYIEALKRNPGDKAAKYNLEVARRMLQQQQQQKQQQEQQKDQQEQKQDQKQDQQPKQDQNQEQKDKQQQPEQQKPDQKPEQQNQQQQAQPEKQMSKEEAERILNALLQNENDALKQAKKVKIQSRGKREKDW